MRTDPLPTLKCLQSYHIRLGLEIADVMSQLSRLPLYEIPGFEPFYNARISYLEDYEGLMEGVLKPSAHHLSWAVQKKEMHLKHCRALLAQTRPARNMIKSVIDHHCQESGEKRSDGKLPDYSLALPTEFEKESFSGDTLRNALIARDCTLARATEVHVVAMKNSYIRRLFRSIHAYCLGAAGAWRDQRLNVLPTSDRDDVTDFLLPLYAADGDIIVTADVKLTRLIDLIEPEKRVMVRKADEL